MLYNYTQCVRRWADDAVKRATREHHIYRDGRTDGTDGTDGRDGTGRTTEVAK